MRESNTVARDGTPARLLRFWFGFSEPVGPRAYFRHGAALMAVKYASDAALVFAATGRFWHPLTYLDPVLSVKIGPLQGTGDWLLWTLAAWTIPFLFAGVNLTMRRAVDAGLSAWISLAFFVPFLNYVIMAWLSVRPSQPPPAWRDPDPSAPGDVQFRTALIGVAWSVAVALPSVALSVIVFQRYSASLFIGTPFSLGVACGYFFNRTAVASLRSTLQVAAISVLLVGGALVVVAIEGALCVMMALPFALAIALLGAAFGRAMALRGAGALGGAAAVVLLPPALFLTETAPPPAAAREVLSVVEIAAPPEVVWRHVVTFDSLTAEPGALFRLGVAYPVRATIAGSGVGALRRCEFTTGAFVEPITAWDAPYRLAFDVRAQPAPMRELSPWRSLDAPHLVGYFRAVRGEFRLVALPGNRTRLEGRTWYELDVAPRFYWHIWADAIVHRIHLRVLDHIRVRAQAA